jgi:hypothetical protein
LSISPMICICVRFYSLFQNQVQHKFYQNLQAGKV